MGDAKKDKLRVGFDSRLKLNFCGSQVTTDAGLLAYRELDEALGLTETGAELLTDSRLGTNKQHLLVLLLRQSIYSRLADYEDVNDAERLAVDPAMRHVVGGRAAQADNEAASTSGVSRFETEMLSQRHSLTALMSLPGQWIDNVHRHTQLRELILDMDSSVSETYGEQEGSAYNGHFGCTCYHPLFLFNQFGDMEYAMLRRGNKASAKYWRRVVAKIEWHAGELFPRVGFIVTNLTKQSKNVVKFYNGRGTAEQWIKEGKNAVKWTKLSCRTFKDNQTQLQLFALTCNLGNFLRRLALPKPVRYWSLTTLREKLVKIGAKVTRHAKYVTFQLAEPAEASGAEKF